MFQLTKSCRLEENLIDLILRSLSLMSKSTENYFLSLDASSLDWVRDLFVLGTFESTNLSVAEDDELMEIRKHGRLKLKHSSTGMGSFWLSL
jgi:hypothetical protein